MRMPSPGKIARAIEKEIGSLGDDLSLQRRPGHPYFDVIYEGDVEDAIYRVTVSVLEINGEQIRDVKL